MLLDLHACALYKNIINSRAKLSQCSTSVLRPTLLKERPANSMEIDTLGGIRTPKPLNRLTLNLSCVIMSAMSPNIPKIKTIPLSGSVSMNVWNFTIAWFLVFLFFVTPSFACIPRLNNTSNFYAVCRYDTMSVLDNCILRKIKCNQFPISDIFIPKTLKKSVNKHFSNQARKIFKLLYYED